MGGWVQVYLASAADRKEDGWEERTSGWPSAADRRRQADRQPAVNPAERSGQTEARREEGDRGIPAALG